MAKKGARITIALRCTETGCVNYHTSVNKVNTPKLERMKYCKKLKRRTLHTAREKLK